VTVKEKSMPRYGEAEISDSRWYEESDISDHHPLRACGERRFVKEFYGFSVWYGMCIRIGVFKKSHRR
jgi:hypothetical protein